MFKQVTHVQTLVLRDQLFIMKITFMARFLLGLKLILVKMFYYFVNQYDL
ncbi:hypothetical protein Y788_13440 [Pantoea dispersa 625]|nr:hypothetical protein Y788_13440 [Pantoea dispersa 625]